MSMEQQINRLIQTEIDSGDLADRAGVIKDGHEVFRHSYGALDIGSVRLCPTIRYSACTR